MKTAFDVLFPPFHDSSSEAHVRFGYLWDALSHLAERRVEEFLPIGARLYVSQTSFDCHRCATVRRQFGWLCMCLWFYFIFYYFPFHSRTDERRMKFLSRPENVSIMLGIGRAREKPGRKGSRALAVTRIERDESAPVFDSICLEAGQTFVEEIQSAGERAQKSVRKLVTRFTQRGVYESL